MRYGYVALEGLIGAGKTTLAHRLGKHWNGRLVLEEFEENPFLPRFYAEPERYAFSVELSFLAQRYHQLKRTTEQDLFAACTIADYSIGKSLVFASVTLPPDEHALFLDLYSIMYADLPAPDLVVYIYLHMDHVRERIRGRGREYEQRIELDYLERLQDRYLDHLQKLTRSRALVVDMGEHDLRSDQAAFERFAELIQQDHPVGCTICSL